jgi:branched-subunit amino acid aminotransferase/4-amino-4-deoxychorismate lyase
MRQYLLDQGRVREAVIPVAWLPHCEEIVLINSVRGWRPVRLINANGRD